MQLSPAQKKYLHDLTLNSVRMISPEQLTAIEKLGSEEKLDRVDAGKLIDNLSFFVALKDIHPDKWKSEETYKYSTGLKEINNVLAKYGYT